MDPPPWLVDEMLGRLARYLRFVGCDAAYVRGRTDDEVIAQAEREGRVVLTRDRQLSRRARAAFFVESPAIAEQWRALRAAWPSVPGRPSFVRCGRCNGSLVSVRPEERTGLLTAIPAGVISQGIPIYRCTRCGQAYWEGSHTAHIRAQLAAWEASTPS